MPERSDTQGRLSEIGSTDSILDNLILIPCCISLIHFVGAQGRLPHDMPQGHNDDFELSITWEAARARRAPWLCSVPLKAGNKSSWRCYHWCSPGYWEGQRGLNTQLRKLGSGSLFASPGSHSFSHSRGWKYCSAKGINTHPSPSGTRLQGVLWGRCCIIEAYQCKKGTDLLKPKKIWEADWLFGESTWSISNPSSSL